MLFLDRLWSLRSTSILLVCAVLVLGLSVSDVLLTSRAVDFPSFFFASRAVRLGDDPYSVDALQRVAQSYAHDDRVFPYLYPPFLAWALRFLPGKSLELAEGYWALLSVVMGAAGLSAVAVRSYVSSGALGTRAARDAEAVRIVLVVLVVALLPVRNNFVMGQVNLVVCGFLGLSLAAARRGRDRWAGALLAPAVLIKVTPVVLLAYFVARRRWWTVAALAATSGLLVAATLTAPHGLASWQAFFWHAPQFSYGQEVPGLFSPAVVQNFSPTGFFARYLGRDAPSVTSLGFGITIALVAVASLTAWGVRDRQAQALASAAFLPVVLLASPLVYLHHVVCLAPAAVIWTGHCLSQRRPGALAAVLTLLVAAGVDWLPLYDRISSKMSPDAPLGPTLTSLNLYALLAVFGVGIALAWAADRSARSSAGEAAAPCPREAPRA